MINRTPHTIVEKNINTKEYLFHFYIKEYMENEKVKKGIELDSKIKTGQEIDYTLTPVGKIVNIQKMRDALHFNVFP